MQEVFQWCLWFTYGCLINIIKLKSAIGYIASNLNIDFETSG